MRRKKKKQVEDEPLAQRPAPPVAFLDWWNPTGVDNPSGASVGGHPDCERIWARKDSGRWTRRTYGINAVVAWIIDTYRAEFNEWRNLGSPEREPFVSVCATLEQQTKFWREIRGVLSAIENQKPVRPRRRDYDKGAQPWVEPIDEKKMLDDGNTIEGEFKKVETTEENSDEPIDF